MHYIRMKAALSGKSSHEMAASPTLCQPFAMPSPQGMRAQLKSRVGFSATPHMTRVLVIDDNDDFRKLALLWFQIHGIEAEGAANGAQGLELQRARPATVIVTDIFMPEKEGIETIQDLRREFPETKIIAMTGREALTDYDVFQVAREVGAIKTLKKPFKLDDLVAVVKELSP
jgi:CheY-like chemotaxis protein